MPVEKKSTVGLHEQSQSGTVNPSNSARRYHNSGRIYKISTEAMANSNTGTEKSLNVIFTYNGHTWDAHEILGIPAGAPDRLFESAYATMKLKSAPESLEFIEAAYLAIKGDLKKVSGK